MKKKKIWIPIVSLVLVAALGTGLALYHPNALPAVAKMAGAGPGA